MKTVKNINFYNATKDNYDLGGYQCPPGEFFTDEEIFLDKVEVLCVLEDFFGWDYIVRLPDGDLVWTDRNCGENQIISEKEYQEMLKAYEPYVTDCDLVQIIGVN